MTLPVPGLTTPEWVRLFEAVHQGLTDRDQARAELETERTKAANLGLDNRALQDRLREAGETIARLGRTQDDAATLIKRLRDPDQPPPPFERAHTGPPGRCQCGMVHSHDQAIRLTAGRLVRDGQVIVADSTETPYLEARDIPAGRDRIEKNT